MPRGILALSALLLASPAAARVIQIGYGLEASTVNEALDKAKPGDEVELATVGKMGGELKKEGDNFVLVSVFPGSAFEEAGLKAGDRIVEINGEWVKPLAVEMGVQKLSGKPGTSVRLTYQRGNDRKDRRAEATRKAARLPVPDELSKIRVAVALGDPAAAADQAKKLARADDKAAQQYLAFAYVNGSGVRQDKEEAARWAKKCAQAGDAPCQRLYGIILTETRGELRDVKGGKEWLKKAAEQGDEPAKQVLAKLEGDKW